MFPPSGGAALARFAHFLVARVAQQYLPHLEKSCAPTGQSISWEARVPTQSAKGRVRAGDRRGAPNPASPRKLFVNDELAQAARVSWARFSRVQSDCSTLVRRLPKGGMDDHLALKSSAVAGPLEGQRAIKLRRRKHVAGGPRTVRSCACDYFRQDHWQSALPSCMQQSILLSGKRLRQSARGPTAQDQTCFQV